MGHYYRIECPALQLSVDFKTWSHGEVIKEALRLLYEHPKIQDCINEGEAVCCWLMPESISAPPGCAITISAIKGKISDFHHDRSVDWGKFQRDQWAAVDQTTQ